MLSAYPLHAAYNMSLMYAVVWTINSHYAGDSSKPLTIVHFASIEASRGLHNDLIDAALRLASVACRIKFLLEGERIVADSEATPDLVAPAAATADADAEDGGLNSQTTAIWLLDSWRAYMRLEHRLLQANSSFKRNGYYCLVYTGVEPARLNIIKQIFRRLFAIYVINVNVFLAQRQTGVVQVYNYYPYRAQHCQSAKPVHYASFPGSLGAAPLIHVENRTLFFDDKLDDMQGCALAVVTFQQRPYVIIDEQDDADGHSVRGIEGMLFQLLAERMNFSTRLLIEPDMNRGTVLPNGTLTGAMRLIVDGRANLTFGAYMYSRERKQYMQPSMVYTSFPVMVCIPGGHQLTPLQRLTRPLGDYTWLCLLLSLLLAGLLIAALRMSVSVAPLRRFLLGADARNRSPCLAMWSILLGGQQQRAPRRTFARYLLALWLLQTLVLRAAYTGELYIILQDGRVRTPLRSLAEVLDQNYVFHMLPSLQLVFRGVLPVKRIRVVANLEPSLELLRDDEEVRIVVSTLQPTVARFDMDSGPTKARLTVLPTPLLTAPLAFYMRPHSYLKHRINKLFMSMMSSGLVHRFRRMYLDRIEHLARIRSREPTRLSLWLTSGIFASLALLQLLACVVFMLELRAAAPQRQRLRRLMDAANRYLA
ncbi:hypothetical protein KR222_011298 [Zaprionus bogoriensis]|nr:hypothetical protein KR222_011298 [Zaprionus bogoriensis]